MLGSLSDKRKYECQQCKNEHTKSCKIFEIKFLIHQHHPILCKIEVSHPATQLFHGLYFIVSYVDILNRTKLSREVGSIPRLVSIDKYNFIVNHLVENVDIIEIVLF